MITRTIMIIVNIMMMTSSYHLPLKLVDQNEVSHETKFWSRNKLSSSQNRESDGWVSWSKVKYIL